ncbi:MAG: helix-turn-helix domain-containing protein [Hyphomicrobiales bacterium]
MLTKKLIELVIADLEALVANQVVENRFIDFKGAPIGNSDRDKREFLADVSAFANASGGDIVLGIKTKDGAAAEITGVAIDDVDKEKLRLGDIIRFGLEPRLSGVDMAWVPIEGSRGVLVIRVSRSWVAPHRVVFLKDMNFYVRNAAGKNAMNIDELRQAFNLSETVAERIRQFRRERVGAICEDDASLPLAGGAKLVLHLVPLSAFVDPEELRFDDGATPRLRPMHASGWDGSHTLEGFITYSGPDPVDAYTLVYRSGIVEVVGIAGGTDEKGNRFVPLGWVEQEVMEVWKSCWRFLSEAGVKAPIYIFLSMVSVRGCRPYVAPGRSIIPRPPRRDVLLVPEIAVDVERVEMAAHVLLQPLFDRLSNAFGLPRSFNYSADGSYKQNAV